MILLTCSRLIYSCVSCDVLYVDEVLKNCRVQIQRAQHYVIARVKRHSMITITSYRDRLPLVSVHGTSVRVSCFSWSHCLFFFSIFFLRSFRRTTAACYYAMQFITMTKRSTSMIVRASYIAITSRRKLSLIDDCYISSTSN